jgi:hypothetical protein
MQTAATGNSAIGILSNFRAEQAEASPMEARQAGGRVRGASVIVFNFQRKAVL